MRILVTGATGFVGSAIVRTLLCREHDVWGLVRSEARALDSIPAGTKVVIGDMCNPASYVPLVSKVDAVVHAAQQKPRGRWSNRSIAVMHRSDAVMTRALAAACLESRKLLVYTSGALAHRPAVDGWIGPGSPLSPCTLARGHAAMVQVLLDLHRRRGLRTTIISPGFVYGPGGFLAETRKLLLCNRYRVIGSGANMWSLVHVDDLATLYALALEQELTGANYFVSDDLPLSRREIVDRLTVLLKLERVPNVSRWLAGLILGRSLVEAICTPLAIRDERPKTLLGWAPRYRTFCEGLPEVLNSLGNTSY